MQRQWTIMVYMAGDNGKIFPDGRQLMANLNLDGWRDIAEMAETVQSDVVTIVVQYDTLDEHLFTPRYVIDANFSPANPTEKISSINTGDPKNLSDFIVWGETQFPAEKYALVLWNHGTGWKEDDIYERYRDEVGKTPEKGEMRAWNKTGKLLNQSLFLSTIREIISIENDRIRGICYDDTSMSFLDNASLSFALSVAENQTGNRLSLLGMDACFMNTIEVACQVYPYADFMVGSQEVEPADGWPYKNIFNRLVAIPSIQPDGLAKIIVEEYGKQYTNNGRDDGGITTQSAINLSIMPHTIELVKSLAENILRCLDEKDIYAEVAISRAKNGAQNFTDNDCLDLSHFARIIYEEYSGKHSLGESAQKLMNQINNVTENVLVTANYYGSRRPNANGVSVYFPQRDCSIYYDKQSFFDTGWSRVIRRFNQIG